MKIITWNVNSIRTRLPRCLALLERHSPDLLCLQETKVEDDKFPRQEIEAAGYQVEVFGQKTYNGVALLSKKPLENVQRGFPGNPIPEQARAIGATLDGVEVWNLYVVNGQALDSPKFPIKMAWLQGFFDWMQGERKPNQDLVVVGDFNIAPEDRDVHDPKKWSGKILCSDQEREKLQSFLDWGLTDLFRLHEAGDGHFTWWDYRAGAFPRGWGLRIDLMLGTASMIKRCRGVQIDREERKKTTGEGTPSDHAPVILELD
ncbi:MAG: exodeoxyribonuclease III [Planctomycetota bacterium]|nr:MAG: exodeoxyribonuclease III [Planctomycetota bacterium]